MALDNIEAVEEEKKVKSDERVSRNSITFRAESFANASEKAKLIAKRNAAAELVSEAISQDVERGRTERIVKDKHFDYAAKIIALDDQIDMLEKPEGSDGKTELVSNRAIRLISKMYKEAKEKSEAIYSEVEQKEEHKTEAVTVPPVVETSATGEEIAVPAIELPAIETPVAAVPTVEAPVVETPVVAVPTVEAPVVETPVVDVEKIANENTVVVDQNIKEAITNEKNVIADSDIKDVVNEAFASVPQVTEKVKEEPIKEVPIEAPNTSDIDVEAIQAVVNEKLDKFMKEYVPMTDEEVAASQEKLQIARHNEINSEIDKKNQEVAEVNAAKGLDDLFVNDSNKEEPLRAEVVVIPERDEPEEEKIEEYTVVEQRSMSMSPEEKAKAHEVLEKLRAARKKKEELEKESSDIDSDIENEKAINMEVSAKEDEAKKTLEESIMAANKAEQDYAEAISAMEKELEDLNSETDAISNGIKVKKEQLANLQEDTANRHREIETIDKQNQSKQEEIAKYEELKAMLSGDTDSLENQKIK